MATTALLAVDVAAGNRCAVFDEERESTACRTPLPGEREAGVVPAPPPAPPPLPVPPLTLGGTDERPVDARWRLDSTGCDEADSARPLPSRCADDDTSDDDDDVDITDAGGTPAAARRVSYCTAGVGRIRPEPDRLIVLRPASGMAVAVAARSRPCAEVARARPCAGDACSSACAGVEGVASKPTDSSAIGTTLVARTKTPCIGGQEKYATPE